VPHAERWSSRLASLTAAKRERTASRERAVAEARTERPISPIALVAALDEVLPDDALVLEEVTTNDAVVREHLRRERPDSIVGIGAAGLGWAPGAALGAKLAEPDRDVVALVGDGSFIFSAPLAWLWAARNARAPFLTVVFNNAGYRAAKFPVVALFPEGASVQTGDFDGTVFADPPAYAMVAEACGAHGEYVEDPAELVTALTRALDAVRAGRCAVVDVRLADI
jgi:acetolactate synthase-1/2/3 large subunit